MLSVPALAVPALAVPALAVAALSACWQQQDGWYSYRPPVTADDDTISEYCGYQTDGGVTEAFGGSNGRALYDGGAVPPGSPPATVCGLTTMDIGIDESILRRMNSRTDKAEALEEPVTVLIQGRVYRDVSMELHGGLARSFEKKSYRLEFPADDPPRLTFFGDEGDPAEPHRRLVLQAAWIDPTFLRNKLTLDLERELGGVAPRVGFAMVYINHKLYGLFSVIERIDREFLERQGYNDGDAFNLYKAVDHLANWGAKKNALDGFEIKINTGNPTDDLARLLRALSETEATAGAFAAEVEPLLDLDRFMTWQMAHTFAQDRDTFTKNYYLYHDLAASAGTPEARFRLIAWDADATWGLSWRGRAVGPDDEDWHGSDRFSPRLFSIPGYREVYLSRYREALERTMNRQTLLDRVERLAGLIRKATELDLYIWAREVDLDAEMERLREAIRSRHSVMKAVITERMGEDTAGEGD